MPVTIGQRFLATPKFNVNDNNLKTTAPNKQNAEFDFVLITLLNWDEYKTTCK